MFSYEAVLLLGDPIIFIHGFHHPLRIGLILAFSIFVLIIVFPCKFLLLRCASHAASVLLSMVAVILSKLHKLHIVSHFVLV